MLEMHPPNLCFPETGKDCKGAGHKVTLFLPLKLLKKGSLIVERFILYCWERGSAKFNRVFPITQKFKLHDLFLAARLL